MPKTPVEPTPESSPAESRAPYSYDKPLTVHWEPTQACSMACMHCRSVPLTRRDPRELDTAQAKELVRQVARMGSLLVLGGGDPMERPDLMDVLELAASARVPVHLSAATARHLTRDVVETLRALNVGALSVGLDAPEAVHDELRGENGSFERGMVALEWARRSRLPVQVATCVTTRTLPHLEELYELLLGLGAQVLRRWSLFFLVPVGPRSRELLPSPSAVRRVFDWIYAQAQKPRLQIVPAEAPHYRRYWIERRLAEGARADEIKQAAIPMSFGVREGNGMLSVAHTGDVHPAGFLPYPTLGNVKRDQLRELYAGSPLQRLRDPNRLKGRCGSCTFRHICGGSRARAYATTADVYAPDPLCDGGNP